MRAFPMSLHFDEGCFSKYGTFFVPGLMFMINNRLLREGHIKTVLETFCRAFIYFSFYAQILFLHIPDPDFQY